MKHSELMSVAVLMGMEDSNIRDSFDGGEYEEFLLDCQRRGKCHKAEWVRMVIEGETIV